MWTKTLEFENKYSLSLGERKKKKQTCVCVHPLSNEIGGTEKYGTKLSFDVGAVHTIFRPLWQTSCGAASIQLVCGWVHDDNVNIHWGKKVHRGGSLMTICTSFSPHTLLVCSLSHIVVLVGILLVTLHIVSVNERLYPLLQVSRLCAEAERRNSLWATQLKYV